MSPAQTARYNARKNRVFQAVEWAASRYDCTSPVDSNSFSGFGLNFQYQVQRAAGLLNSAGMALSPAQISQASVNTADTGNAPKVIPLNPVDTNPKPQSPMPTLGPWDTPSWGDAATILPASCTPLASLLQAMQDHPFWTLGALGALVLIAGGTEVAVHRRRTRRRRAR